MVVVWQSRIDGERYKEMVSCEREEKQRQKMERLRVCYLWKEEKKKKKKKKKK